MKLNKIFLLGFVMVFGLSLASCSDDDDWAPGKPAGDANVTFYDETAQTVSLEDTEMEVVLSRENASGELTVPLKVVEADTAIFQNIPSSVTFQDGESLASVKIGLSDKMESFVAYPLALSIPEEYTNSYKDTTACASYRVTVTKDDWKNFAVMQTNNWAWTPVFDASGIGETDAQYSQYLGLLRIHNFMGCAAFADELDETYMYIKWDGDVDKDANVVLTNSTGEVLEKPFYNGISADFCGYDCYYYWAPGSTTTYTASTKTFTIPVTFYLYYYGYYSQGSGNDTYTILSLTDK